MSTCMATRSHPLSSPTDMGGVHVPLTRHNRAINTMVFSLLGAVVALGILEMIFRAFYAAQTTRISEHLPNYQIGPAEWWLAASSTIVVLLLPVLAYLISYLAADCWQQRLHHRVYFVGGTAALILGVAIMAGVVKALVYTVT